MSSDLPSPRDPPGPTPQPPPLELVQDSTVAAGSAASAPDAGPLELRRGDRIGRYLVEEELGAGAQGVVVRATDTELGRSLAIKVLRSTDPRARARMLREARALALLEHPNIVRVFDVGEHHNHVFVAMEHIDGWNLAQWWARQPANRGPRIAALCQAGRGLAAAHAAGLVHRDFKPTNVLVARDGRVVVTDFGLVLGLGPADAPRLTDPHAMVGTPGYMAPEQVMGVSIDFAADQFAFCVSLFEATYGTRPFKGRGAAELIGAMAQRIAKPPGDAGRAPGWLRRVIEHGLDPDPALRFASMDELLAAIEKGPRLRRRVGLAIVIAAFATAAWFAIPRTATPPALERGLAALAGPMAALGGPTSAWTDDRVNATLKDVAADFTAGRSDAARTAAETIRIAAVAAGDESLAAAALWQRGRAEVALGDTAAARTSFESLVEDSQRRGDHGRVAYAALGLLELDTREGQLDRALRWGDQAEEAAERAHLPDLMLDLQIRRAAIGFARGDLAGAEAGYYAALDLVEDTPTGRRMRAVVLNNLGAIAGSQRQLERAAALLTESVHTYEEVLPQGHPELVGVEINLGMARFLAGDTVAGMDLVYAALARVQQAHVELHPDLAGTYLAIAAGLLDVGDAGGCLRHAEKAATILAQLDAQVRSSIEVERLVSVCALQLGDLERAEAAGARAMAVIDTVEVDAFLATRARFVYAQAVMARGRREGARRAAVQALESCPDPVLAAEIEAWIAASDAADRRRR